MPWSNDKATQAVLALLEHDQATVAQAIEHALPAIEGLVLRAARAGLIDVDSKALMDEAGRVGWALSTLRDALNANRRWLAIIRESRPDAAEDLIERLEQMLRERDVL